MKRSKKPARRVGLQLEFLEERLVPAITGSIGDGLPIDNLQPYTTLNYCIAIEGVFPSRNLSLESFIGAVDLFAGTFAPRGWAKCEGQLLSIADNTALFSVLGTKYGGDGQEFFALPDLRGRVPIGASDAHPVGSTTGSLSVTLSVDTLATHGHTIPDVPIAGTNATGGGQPLDNLQPSLALTPLITREGTFPTSSLSVNDLIGSVSWFAGDFEPVGYAIANGQLLSVQDNIPLYSLIGTTYGGDGVATFAVPDLRGRTVIGAGTDYQVGQMGGNETNTLGVQNLPAHSHSVPGSPPGSTGATGAGVAVTNLQPFLALNYAISLFGIFPSQDLNASDHGSFDNTPAGTGFVSGTEVLDVAVATPLVQQVFQQGIDLWVAAGIDPDQVLALESARFEFVDLGPGRLALAGDNQVIQIDRDAAGRGWFIDATSDENSEFGSTDSITGELLATDSAAVGHFDLLTAIAHEQGHLLGFDHTKTPGRVMYGGLSAGRRILPSDADLVLAADSTSTSQFLEASDPIIASVGMFVGNFIPLGWAGTRGQALDPFANMALFSLLGTNYGGDGSTTFNLPDLTGRAVVGAGSGFVLGQLGGSATISLTQGQLPSHSHSFEVSAVPTATNLNAAESYTEDVAANLTDIVVSDVDSSNVIVTLTLSDTVAGSLNTATSGGVTSTYVAATGVWTASGAIADVNTLLAGLVFTPNLNFSSSFSIATSVTDGIVIPVTGNKPFTGTAVNDAPLAGDDIRPTLIKGGPNGIVNILANDTDAEGNPIAPVNGAGQFTVDLNPGVAGIQTTFTDSTGTWSLDTTTGVVTFAPVASFIGTASIPYTLTDPTGLSDTANITFAVLLKNTNLLPASVVSGSDTTGNNSSAGGSISADGRFTVFTSTATNLVEGQVDSSNTQDVFLFDNQTGTVTLVSRQSGSLATTANGESGFAVISADGRFVVYKSSATNLFSGQIDTNNGDDIFLFDRESGTSRLVSRANGTTNTTANNISGSTTLALGPSAISANGRFVAFVSFASNMVAGMDATSISNVYLFDAQENAMQLVSRTAASAVTPGSGFSLNPVLSADGRFVAFTSEAGNLVPGQVDHSVWDVFLFDRNQSTNPTILVSGTGGSATETGNGESFSDLELAISEDGRYVAFKSFADDLVPGVTDTNHNSDIFLFDRDAGGVRTTLVSHDRNSLTTAATGGSASSEKPVMSNDGRFVAYQSTATSIVANDANSAYDVYLYDRVTHANALVSHANGSTASANGASTNPVISSDSTNDNFVAYNSTATNLVAGQVDANSLDDVFIYSRINFNNLLASGNSGSAITSGNGASRISAVNSDGSAITFTSLAGNLGGSDANDAQDVFVRATIVPTTTKISFRAQSYTAQENGGTARIRVDRVGDTTVSAAVDYRVFAGSGANMATAGLDFVADEGTLIFAPGETTLTFDVMINDDSIQESSEKVLLELLDPTSGAQLGTISTAEITILDNDGLAIVDINFDGTLGSDDRNSFDRFRSSADGRFVAFTSGSQNLVSGFVDGNGIEPELGTVPVDEEGHIPLHADVFIRDRLTGVTTLISRNNSGTASGNGGSYLLEISDSGQFIFYVSSATNLVTGVTDINEEINDYFVYDQLTGTNTLVSVSRTGAFTANGTEDAIFDAKMSRDGRYYFFKVFANNLVESGVDVNLAFDLYRFDLLEHKTELVSVNKEGHASGLGGTYSTFKISDDGNIVVFESDVPAFNMVDAPIADPVRGPRNDYPEADTYDQMDLFLRNMTTGETRVVTVNRDGDSVINYPVGVFEVSPDGKLLAFDAYASDVTFDPRPVDATHMYLQDLTTGVTTLIRGDSSLSHLGRTTVPNAFSGDGRFLLFNSNLPDLVSGLIDTNDGSDLFRYDLQHHTILPVSLNVDGTATGQSLHPPIIERSAYAGEGSISWDGRHVAFRSNFSDLVGDVPFITLPDGSIFDYYDFKFFVRDLETGITTLVSALDGHDYVYVRDSQISENGQFVFFTMQATGPLSEIPTPSHYVHLYVSPGEFSPGTFQFADISVDVGENGAEAVVTVNRTGGTNGTFVFSVATQASSAANGADKVATPNVDFLSQNRTIIFEDGQTSATIRIPIVNDDDDEQNETFEVRLTDFSGLSLLGSDTIATVTIVDNDTKVVGNRIVEEDGDVVTITLKGSGALNINLIDPDGNGKGPIQLDLSGTSVSSSILSFKVTKGPSGDGFANVAQITGSGGLKSLAGQTVNLTGSGLRLDGTVLSLSLHDLVNGADIALGGQASDFIKLALHNTSAGSTIDVHSGIKTLTANRIFRTEINVSRGIDTLTVGRLVGSSIFASFTPTSKTSPLAGGTFTSAVAIKKVSIKGISGDGPAFSDSVLAAARIGTVALASYDTTSSAGTFTEYGIVADISIDKLSSKLPKLVYNPSGPDDQNFGLFHIKRI